MGNLSEGVVFSEGVLRLTEDLDAPTLLEGERMIVKKMAMRGEEIPHAC